MTSETLPLLIIAAYGGLWIATLITNQRLLKLFIKKRPDLVAKYFPEATGGGRNPKKFFFFLKPSTAKLFAYDSELLRLRNRLVRLSFCIFLFLLIVIISMVLIIITHND